MLLPRFEYRHATSLPQATTLLAESPGAQALAGGTDLLVDLRERRRQPAILVDIGQLSELQGIHADAGATRIGGGVTVGELLASPLGDAVARIIEDSHRLIASWAPDGRIELEVGSETGEDLRNLG